IYLNLLILETSLRSQYLELRARRRQNSFFIVLLGLWISYFAWALFLRPREDGRGVGGSVYWVIETVEKLALLGGVFTAILIWGTGQWERGVRWPRRWLAVANRGLRGINCKIVVIRGPWWQEILSYFTFLFPFSALLRGFNNPLTHVGIYQHPHHHPHQHHGHHGHHHTTPKKGAQSEDLEYHEEDLTPGGDHIKLLLLPKFFSPAFRDNWDQYRIRYWERENERRAQLRRRLVEREKEKSRRKTAASAGSSWLSWLGIRQKPSPRPEKRLTGGHPTPGGGGSRPSSRGGGHHSSQTPRTHARRSPSIRRSGTPTSFTSDGEADAAGASPHRKSPSVSMRRTRSKRSDSSTSNVSMAPLEGAEREKSPRKKKGSSSVDSNSSLTPLFTRSADK
ncbi:hypothetical protein KEM55_009189, partial [Ascosphaera atra]